MSYPERIVCLAAEVPDILFRLGALDKVVGISAYTTQPEQALHIPKVSGFKHGSIDRIMSVRPDVVILTSSVQKDLSGKLASAGATMIHFNPHRLENLYESIQLLGNLVNKSETAKKLNEQVQRKIDGIQRSADQFSSRPKVYFEEWMDPLICGTGWVSDLIEIAGGQDVFREKSTNGRSALDRVVTHTDVIEANPDIILASWCGEPFNPDALLTRPGYERIAAIQQGWVNEVSSEILQFGPTLVDYLEQLHKMFRMFPSVV